MIASWKDPYDSNVVSSPGASFLPLTPFSENRSTYATTPATATVTASKSTLISLPPPPRTVAPAPPKADVAFDAKSDVVATASIKMETPAAGRFKGAIEVRQSYDSDSDSPVYGINGIIKREASKKRREAERQQQQQEIRIVEPREANKSGVESYSPSRPLIIAAGNKGFGRQAPPSNLGDGPITPSYLSGGPGMSESLKSDFSLRDFPSPPGVMGFPSPSPPAPVPTLPNGFKLAGAAAASSGGSKVRRTPASSAASASSPVAVPDDTESVSDLKIVDDVQFAMIPVQRPVVAMSNPRRASFPTMVRESGASSFLDGTTRILSGYAESEDEVGAKRVRISGMDNRLDVTSFIGELTIPQNARFMGQSQGRLRNDSRDYQLSPLPEDNSPRPSVEIIDMRFKSPTFTPAVTIVNSGADKRSVSKVAKVSFAPDTYGGSSSSSSSNTNNNNSRSKLKPSSPTNTLPASPRPSNGGGSPTGSLRLQNPFKPAVSSPLASPRPVTNSANESAVTTTTTTRPIISGPMPLGSMGVTSSGGRKANYQP
ncbi:hypothetical protein FRC17_007851, partial [Serendipita sp. 399]